MTSKLGVTPSRFGEIAIGNLQLNGGTIVLYTAHPFISEAKNAHYTQN